MARLFSDENFPLPTVIRLRELGHQVLTLQETGNASLAITDSAVLAFAIQNQSAILTLNRRHFIRLHQTSATHHGIIVCTVDPDFTALAERIDKELSIRSTLVGQLIRINRPC